MSKKNSAGSLPADKKTPAAGKAAAGKSSAPKSGEAPAQAASTIDPVGTNGEPPVGDTSASTDGAGASEGDSSVKFLIGTNILPSLILIGGVEVQLGTVVMAAHVASGLTGEAWNELDPVERDKLLTAQVDLMVAAAEAEEAAATAQAPAEKSAKKEAKRESKNDIKGRDLDFPLALTLRNNSPIPVVEPETNAYIGAGGSFAVAVHSAGQLHNVRQNLDAIADKNYFDRDKLVIDGLPD